MVKDKKWALIIGGSQGLGLASAEQLAQDGFNLIIIHRDFRTALEHIQNTFDGLRKHNIEVMNFNKDALKPETISEVFQLIKSENIKIKLLLHSVAKGNLKMLSGDNAMTLNDYQQTVHAMGLNFYEWSKVLVDSGQYAKHTKLLAFTSEGNQKASIGYGAVSAAKATLEAIMRQMALEFAPMGITSNCIQAGVTLTKSFAKIPNAEQIQKHTEKRNPFNRLTTPEDVAKVVSLLADDKANWINGSVIPVDGGERLR
jgi:NAD(P)-dependent dehydrogenase (short-subunit alcohol dehydrogenase family)